MRVIVVNSGSSSIKYEAFDANGLSAVAKSLLERIGTPDSRLKHRWLSISGSWEEIVETRPVADHREGFSFILEVSRRGRSGDAAPEVCAVGHRVVHGGEKFREPVIIDDAVRKYIDAYYAALGAVDALVFTGGIGENSAVVRSRACEGLTALGISLDEGRNSKVAGDITEIQDEGCRVKILVIPTDEEQEIARQTIEVIDKGKGAGAGGACMRQRQLGRRNVTWVI